MKVWFFVDDCGQDENVQWESSNMDYDFAYKCAADFFRSGPAPVPMRNYIDEVGRSHIVLAEDEDMESFRKFIGGPFHP